MNYDLEMMKQLERIPKGTKLLLHACCAPCSSLVLERLANHFSISVFYYNPNISDSLEYQKRIQEMKRLLSYIQSTYPITLIEGDYDPNHFFNRIKGLEEEPERGKRCFECYSLRLEETAKIAEKFNYPYFCTTLTLSPHKNSIWLNEIGKRLEEEYSTLYLYSDFKKRGGYQRSIELSKKYQLYRQDYCGCIYSKR